MIQKFIHQSHYDRFCDQQLSVKDIFLRKKLVKLAMVQVYQSLPHSQRSLLLILSLSLQEMGRRENLGMSWCTSH